MSATTNGWRRDIARIRYAATGTQSEDWRNDLMAIAGGARDWRDAIRIWADGFGVSLGSWRSNLNGIARALGSPVDLHWREALRYIAENYTPIPPNVWDDAQIWDDNNIWNDRVVA